MGSWDSDKRLGNLDEAAENRTREGESPVVEKGTSLTAAVLQGTHDNYQIDLFKNIIKSAENFINKKVSDKNISSYRVIADHLIS